MIQVIGLIIAVYAMTRLFQVPLENHKGRQASAWLVGWEFPLIVVMSLIGLFSLAFLTLELLMWEPGPTGL